MRDLAALLGFALIFAGCWWIHPPCALIVCGVLLLGLSIWGAVRANP